MGRSSEHDSRAVFAWALYDFANSAFTTLIVTFVFATYFTKEIVGDETAGTALWSRAVTLSAVVAALLSPLAGAMADRGGRRKTWLMTTTAVCVLGTSMLYFAGAGDIRPALIWFVVANVAYEMGLVFYNAFLPEIAPAGKIGRVSGYGWSLGYIGGLGCLVLALVGFVQPETPWFGLAREGEQNIRATHLLAAAWFAVFSIPMFIRVRERVRPPLPEGAALLPTALRQLRDTLREIRSYEQVVRLLAARLIYNDGLVTIFAFGGIYAQGTFGFDTTKILVFGIVLNVAAGLGAFVMGFLDDRAGGKRTIQISLAGLLVAAVLAVLAPNETLFWIAGILVGIFAGPNQSSSRSLLGRFVPRQKRTEFFGFYAFSGKATAFLGPLLLGVLTTTFDSQRAGVAVVLVFFVVGWLVLNTVDEAAGIRRACFPGDSEPSSDS
jgi:UMF1 family MFS transporter